MTTLAQLLPTSLEAGIDWPSAACSGSNPELWFPFPTDQYSAAAQVCARCPIRDECGEYGVTHRMSGVWGGIDLDRGRPVQRAS